MGALCSLDAIPLVVYRILPVWGFVYFAISIPLILDWREACGLKSFWRTHYWGALVTFTLLVAGVSLTLSMMATGAFITAMIEP